MWKCHKCGKPVYFAERKQSLGYDWHPECLRCEECGKRLNPGQHAEHKGVPYCHVPCYGALFGPQLFGHGTRVESHKSFGQKGPIRSNSGTVLPRSHLESKLKVFNQFYDSMGKSGEVRSREVNGRLVLEGALRVHWGVRAVIHLKEDVDQRTLVTRGRPKSQQQNGDNSEDDDDLENTCNDVVKEVNTNVSSDVTTTKVKPNISNSNHNSPMSPVHKCLTLPPKLDVKQLDWDELDDLLQVERKVEDSDKLYQTMPVPLPSQSSLDDSENSKGISQQSSVESSSDSIEEPVCDSNSSTLKPDRFPEFDEETLKPGMFEYPTHTIDATRINDSLKLYSDSFLRNGENMEIIGLRRFDINDYTGQLDATRINDTLNLKCDESNGTLKRVKKYEEYISKPVPLQKSHSGHCSRSISQDDSWIEQTDKAKIIPDESGESEDDINILMNDSGQGASADSSFDEAVVLRRPIKTGSTAIKRRPGKRRSRTKLQRRCSINGHFYNRETSFFTPPHGSQMSVWVSSLLDTRAVISLLLDKYKVDASPDNFALFVVRDNGEQRRLTNVESPLVRRVLLGPHEDVARIFLMDCSAKDVSSSVAQFLNLSVAECKAILQQYHSEEHREVTRIQEKYREMRKRIIQRMESLKVRL